VHIPMQCVKGSQQRENVNMPIPFNVASNYNIEVVSSIGDPATVEMDRNCVLDAIIYRK